jgi:hypothetical protein
MMRISPFSEAQSNMPDPDRVNVWPLMYHNLDHTSVAWPIVDVDSTGFAIRPVLNKEQQDWSVLFPLSSYNTKRKVGWLGPLYHYEDYDGLFPLYHFSDDLDFVGPIWWTDEKAYGVFPVFGKGDEVVYLAPFWRKTREGKLHSAGVFPLFRTNGDMSHLWLWPLYKHKLKSASRTHSLLLGMGLNETRENGDYTRRLFPVYFSGKNGDEKSTALLPLYYGKKSDHGSVHLNPLFGVGRDAEGNRNMTSVLGPLWVNTVSGGERDWYCALIGHYRNASETPGASWRLWPFAAWSSEPSLPDLGYHGTLARYRKTKRKSEFRMTPLVYYKAYRDEAGEAERSAWGLWPMVGSSETAGNRSFYVTLLHHTRTGEKSSSMLWPLASYSSEASYPNWLYSFTLAGFRNRTGSKSWHFTPLLYSYRSKELSKKNFALSSWTTRYNLGEVQRRTGTLPLGIARYDANLKEDTKKWSLLYGAINYKQDRERSRFSLLKYLYRRDQKGDEIARDIFPFIKWDSAPDNSRFSLLWHVLNIERQDEKWGGHFLFVPF